jgi:hypothetical protein
MHFFITDFGCGIMVVQYVSCSAKSNVLKYFQPYNITEETWTSLTNDTKCRSKANAPRKQPDISVAARQEMEPFLDCQIENEPVRGTVARTPEHPPCLRIGRQDTTFELEDRSGTKNLMSITDIPLLIDGSNLQSQAYHISRHTMISVRDPNRKALWHSKIQLFCEPHSLPE